MNRKEPVQLTKLNQYPLQQEVEVARPQKRYSLYESDLEFLLPLRPKTIFRRFQWCLYHQYTYQDNRHRTNRRLLARE